MLVVIDTQTQVPSLVPIDMDVAAIDVNTNSGRLYLVGTPPGPSQAVVEVRERSGAIVNELPSPVLCDVGVCWAAVDSPSDRLYIAGFSPSGAALAFVNGSDFSSATVPSGIRPSGLALGAQIYLAGQPEFGTGSVLAAVDLDSLALRTTPLSFDVSGIMVDRSANRIWLAGISGDSQQIAIFSEPTATGTPGPPGPPGPLVPLVPLVRRDLPDLPAWKARPDPPDRRVLQVRWDLRAPWAQPVRASLQARSSCSSTVPRHQRASPSWAAPYNWCGYPSGR